MGCRLRRVLTHLLIVAMAPALAACRDDASTTRVSPSPDVTVASVSPTAAPSAVTERTALPPTVAVTPAPRTTPAAFIPRFEPGRCPFKLGAGQIEGRTVICGRVDVPEEHARPDGPRITLAVARYLATGNQPAPDPMIWLDGGPGAPSLSGAAEQISTLVSRLFTEERDLVLFDQRGVGASTPALGCVENIDLKYQMLDKRRTPEQIAVDDLAAVAACRERLRGQGVNLAAYTSAENAADVNAIRVALGYSKVNLYGVSYGSRLALTVIRDFPDIVRSAVLDSTVPLQANLYIEVAANAQRAFDAVFDGCAADPVCTRAFPGLRQVFTDLANRLNAEPVLVQVTHPRSGRRHDLLLTGDQFVGGLFQTLYRTDLIPAIPKIISMAQGGDFAPFANAVRDILFYDDLSHGMYYSVQCGEELAFATPAQVEGGARLAQPEVARAVSTAAENDALFTLCRQWGARVAAPLENVAVRSAVPTLILAGQFDPITPPAWGRLAGETLTRAFYFEYPGIGHGVMVAALCPLNMTRAFLTKPFEQPDATCIQRMSAPRWQT